MGKQVLTPRFYVDIPSFLHAIGDIRWGDVNNNQGVNPSLLYINPSNPLMRAIDEDETPAVNEVFFGIGDGNVSKPPRYQFPINFCGLLNHNFASDEHTPTITGLAGIFNSTKLESDWINLTHNTHAYEGNILNANTSAHRFDAQYNGTSIWELKDHAFLNQYWRRFYVHYNQPITHEDESVTYWDDSVNHQLGSFVVGKYFDCPKSPDLSLTMERKFDGIKKQTTLGGKTHYLNNYDGPREWTMNHPIDNILNGTYKYPPFELDTTKQVDTEGYRFDYRAKSGLGRKGLRSWKLSFSYISESDMWMGYESSSLSPFSDSGFNSETGGTPPMTFLENDGGTPMLNDDSFNFVLNCTLGGTLPFIFQPDNTNSNPDQFAICLLKNNSISITQTNYNTYKVSLVIEEIG